MQLQFRLIVLLITFGFPVSSLAATQTVTVSVPSLIGTHEASLHPGIFDLGVQFSSISSLSFDWEAISTPGEIRTCDASVGSCSVSSYELDLEIAIFREDSAGEWDISGGGLLPLLPFGYLDPAQTTFGPFSTIGYEGFPTGRGLVWLGASNSNDGFVLTDATISISSFNVSVTGTVVPLPAALPLLFSGLIGLLFFQRKRKQA